MQIRVRNNQKIKINAARIKRLIGYALKKEGINAADIEIGVLVADNKEIKVLNKQYLNRSNITDVISFRMWEGPYNKVQPEILGDIVINAELAKRIGNPFERELALYVVHGLLHVLGYIDDTKKNAKKMQDRCDKILEDFVC